MASNRRNALRTGRFDFHFEITFFAIMEAPSSIFPSLHSDLRSAHKPSMRVS